MRLVWVIAPIGLGVATNACTIAVHDPTKFEAQATHLTRTYKVPMEPLFHCFAQSRPDINRWQVYVAGDTAHAGRKGLVTIQFTKTDSGTNVRVSAIEGGDASIGAEPFASALNVCASELA